MNSNIKQDAKIVIYKDNLEGIGSYVLILLEELLKMDPEKLSFYIPFSCHNEKEVILTLKETIEDFTKLDGRIQDEARTKNTLYVIGFDLDDETKKELEVLTNEVIIIKDDERNRTLPRVLFEDFLSDKVQEDENVLLYREIQELVYFTKLTAEQIDVVSELNNIRNFINYREYLLVVLRQMTHLSIANQVKTKEDIVKIIDGLKENISFLNMRIGQLSLELMNKGIIKMSGEVSED